MAKQAVKSSWTAKDSLAELTALAYSAGTEVVGELTQKMSAPSKLTYLGKGKMEDLRKLKNDLNYDTVIADDELTPLQQQNLEEFLEAKVIDRVDVILDIFARRARTREGKLQVELAQYEYNLPRLAGKWHHLERLGAGIGTRGPGESQLETDKRIMRQKIRRLKQQIEQLRSQRELSRKNRRRSAIPVVALVGYTNTGKSTMLNALSRAKVLVKDELFSTLDPTTRRLLLPDNHWILLTDTVGFIRHLPPALIEAFSATLEELTEASLLVHVVDLTAHNAAEQFEAVEDLLRDLNIVDKPRITALNKIDLLLAPQRHWDEQAAQDYYITKCGQLAADNVLISATRRWGFNRLLEMISQKLALIT